MSDEQNNSSSTVASVLGDGNKGSSISSWLKQHKYWVAGGVFAAGLLLVWLFVGFGGESKKTMYQEAEVLRGQLVVKVIATGNLQPTNQVDIGSELSGTIEKVFVDDNDLIKKGQVLARLDTAKLKDQVQNSEAALVASNAKVQQAIATKSETQAELDRFREVWKLSGGKVPSKTEMAKAEANLARAVADEASARASVSQARANLRTNQTNLSKAIIRSPIDGVVLLREVEPGQTVAASLQAPVLFTLAESLSNMELQVAVDEADVGQVKEGQDASFSVDAYPNRQYPAKITRVGYGAQTTDGVVSYLTILSVNNDDLTLRPGMTATAEITTLVKENALLVPNAALRFEPQKTQKANTTSILSKIFPRRPRRSDENKQATKDFIQGDAQNLWVLKNGAPEAMQVIIGASNGRYTEIIKGELKEGMMVIVNSTAGGM